MSQPDFSVGEKLVERGEYEAAFKSFADIAGDSSARPEARADACTWMGTLVGIVPALGQGDECGLSFYKEALRHDPSCVGALLGIVETFGEHIPDHSDGASFRAAMESLWSRLDTLDEAVRQEVIRIRQKHENALPGVLASRER